MCSEELPLESFGHDKRNKSGRKSSCRSCERKMARVSYQKHRQSRIEKTRKYRQQKGERYNKNRREKRHFTRITEASRKYGISKETVVKLLETKICPICGNEMSFDHKDTHAWPNIDHCHASGKVRGVICGRCNNLLGRAKDNVTILKKAISYLNQNG